MMLSFPLQEQMLFLCAISPDITLCQPTGLRAPTNLHLCTTDSPDFVITTENSYSNLNPRPPFLKNFFTRFVVLVLSKPVCIGSVKTRLTTFFLSFCLTTSASRIIIIIMNKQTKTKNKQTKYKASIYIYIKITTHEAWMNVGHCFLYKKHKNFHTKPVC